MHKESINSHPVFAAMTRPPMFLGITIDYLMFAMFFSIFGFMALNSAKFLLLYIPLHIFGWIGCKFDQNFFSVILKKTLCSNVRNKSIWGCQSYEPY